MIRENNYEKIMFENNYILTKERFMEWGKESEFSGKHLFFRVYWLIFAIICVVLGIITQTWGAIVAVLFCIYRGCIRWKVLTNRQYNMISKQYRTNNWTRRILFQVDSINVIDVDISIKYKYEDIIEIKEKDNYIKLIANNGTVIRLYADAFVESNWEECKKFIQGKMLKIGDEPLTEE